MAKYLTNLETLENVAEARMYLEKLDNFDYKFKIGEYFLNKWHFLNL